MANSSSSRSSGLNDENVDNNVANSSQSQKEKPEWLLARQGINLVINNNQADAAALFLQYPSSLVMFAGYNFTVFMDALMSFEDEKLAKAISGLKEVEKRCSIQAGWIKSLSQKVFGTASTDETRSVAEQLETQIILADSQVCIAILTFLQQDLSAYFKGGWVLRKAWKIYQSTYKEILTLYKAHVGELNLPDPIMTPLSPPSPCNPQFSDSDEDVPVNGYLYKPAKISHSRSLNFTKTIEVADPNKKNKIERPTSLALKKSNSVVGSLGKSAGLLGSAKLKFSSFSNVISLSNLTTSLKDILPGQFSENQPIQKRTIIRLMEAISFGYGLFQLGVSLLPPSLARLVSLLGFAAGRQHGISCLMYARLGEDMRAPLASLALLWYHTIVRPFYAIDGTNVQAGVVAANALIQESKKEFGESALFLFFAGRAGRLNSDIRLALTSFQRALENATHHEIKMLCLHEIGWCHLIELDYQNAKASFMYLKTCSRWSRSFYAYLGAICSGVLKDYANYQIFDELQECTATTKGGQLDEFLSRRIRCCPVDADSAKQYSARYFKLLVFEMLYLWNALPSCKPERIDSIIEDCRRVKSEPKGEPRNGLASLITGSAYAIRRKPKEAKKCFRECLERRRAEPKNADDAHISAFAHYELGNILIQDPQTTAEGKLLLQQISQYEHYDFEARLEVRIHSILRHLDNN